MALGSVPVTVVCGTDRSVCLTITTDVSEPLVSRTPMRKAKGSGGSRLIDGRMGDGRQRPLLGGCLPPRHYRTASAGRCLHTPLLQRAFDYDQRHWRGLLTDVENTPRTGQAVTADGRAKRGHQERTAV